jgi:hypothetical protein
MEAASFGSGIKTTQRPRPFIAVAESRGLWVHEGGKSLLMREFVATFGARASRKCLFVQVGLSQLMGARTISLTVNRASANPINEALMLKS